jgi:hypothetical protein
MSIRAELEAILMENKLLRLDLENALAENAALKAQPQIQPPGGPTATKRKYSKLTPLGAVSPPASEVEIFQVGQHVYAEYNGEWCEATVVKAKSTSRYEVVERHPRKKKSVSWTVSLEELRNEKHRLGAEKQEAMKRARPNEDKNKEASALPDPTASATTTAPEEPGRVEVQFATKDACFADKKEGVVVRCSRCPTAAHPACAGWTCPTCTAALQQEMERWARLSKTVGPRADSKKLQQARNLANEAEISLRFYMERAFCIGGIPPPTWTSLRAPSGRRYVYIYIYIYIYI